MKFGDHLKQFRKKAGISQEELAYQVGVSRQSVSKWETSEAYPEMSHIMELCHIFHCHINDLVHESFVDIEKMDDDIQKQVVKFRIEKQRKMKKLSMFIYVLARIGNIISILGGFFILLTMIKISIIIINVKVTSNQISVWGEKILYRDHGSSTVLNYQGHEVTISSFKDQIHFQQLVTFFQEHSNLSIIVFSIVVAIILVITLGLLYFAFQHLEQLFFNVHHGDTPFTLDNVHHIKYLACLFIVVILLPNIVGIITQIIIGVELGIGFELMDFIYILGLYNMAYIFEYGYEIQLDSNGKMYREINE